MTFPKHFIHIFKCNLVVCLYNCIFIDNTIHTNDELNDECTKLVLDFFFFVHHLRTQSSPRKELFLIGRLIILHKWQNIFRVRNMMLQWSRNFMPSEMKTDSNNLFYEQKDTTDHRKSVSKKRLAFSQWSQNLSYSKEFEY